MSRLRSGMHNIGVDVDIYTYFIYYVHQYVHTKLLLYHKNEIEI